MKCFIIICTFLIVICNVGTLISFSKQVKVFRIQIGLNKKQFKLVT